MSDDERNEWMILCVQKMIFCVLYNNAVRGDVSNTGGKRGTGTGSRTMENGNKT